MAPAEHLRIGRPVAAGLINRSPQLGVPVLTTDRKWRNVVVEGLRLEHVR